MDESGEDALTVSENFVGNDAAMVGCDADPGVSLITR